MTGLVDLHCHILPYVDDGAFRKEESGILLEMLYRQGVRAVCATPHLRKGMFETPDEDIQKQFRRFLEREEQWRGKISLFLSREYHCDELLLEKLDRREVLPLGNGSSLLIEFSQAHSEGDMHRYISIVKEHGFRPLIAHVERFPVLMESTAQIRALIEQGADLQMNAGSILGREGLRQANWCKKLLKEELITVVGSDAHDPEDRPPELDRCKSFLARKFGNAYAEDLMSRNPRRVLGIPEGE